ncbi:MAG: hypothetical protein BroJett018_24650 [Chloroflexota bacterium]|nr:MAG: hypothetical protein BroJett018_24650 [Chloroflexota bacterium]
MPLLTQEKALRSLRKTPGILRAVLRGVDQQTAASLTDGPDGWNVVFIVCHVADYEMIYTERVRRILNEEEPQFDSPMDNDEMPIAHRYAEQQLSHMVGVFEERRRKFIALIESLNEEQLARRGYHPVSGYGTALDYAINAALHDVNHIEQITKVLKIGEGF